MGRPRNAPAMGHHEASPLALEACSGCGRSTAVGSVHFSDRRRIEALSGPAYLCAECHAALRGARGDRPLTDAEVRRVVDSGNAVGLIWGGGGTPGMG
jgi:hypothetical protein